MTGLAATPAIDLAGVAAKPRVVHHEIRIDVDQLGHEVTPEIFMIFPIGGGEPAGDIPIKVAENLPAARGDRASIRRLFSCCPMPQFIPLGERKTAFLSTNEFQD